MRIDNDILALDLECIAYKVCRDERWPLERVDRIELEYRAFLQLVRNRTSSDEVAPTKAVDIFWHHHILDTAKYFEDCDHLFGAYLHHYPYSGVFGTDDSARQDRRVASSRDAIERLLAMEETV